MSSAKLRVGLTGLRGVLARTLQQSSPEIHWLPFAGNVQNLPALTDWMQTAMPLNAIIHLAAVVFPHSRWTRTR